jgi:hypothetical protein
MIAALVPGLAVLRLLHCSDKNLGKRSGSTTW